MSYPNKLRLGNTFDTQYKIPLEDYQYRGSFSDLRIDLNRLTKEQLHGIAFPEYQSKNYKFILKF